MSNANGMVGISNPVTGNYLAINADGSIDTAISGLKQDVTSNKMFSFGADVNQVTSGTNNRIVLIRNPAASGKVIYIHKIQFGVNVTNVEAECKIFSGPTITANGTAITIGSRNVGGASPASVVTAFTLPTITANGTQLANLVSGQNNNSIISADDFSLAIQPGGNLLITGNPSSNNRIASVTVSWLEE